MKDLLTGITNFVGLAWWIEINTDIPKCLYYFGPFISQDEALLYKDGYIEDLQQEKAESIFLNIKRCKPTDITIFDDELVENKNNNADNVLSFTTT